MKNPSLDNTLGTELKAQPIQTFSIKTLKISMAKREKSLNDENTWFLVFSYPLPILAVSTNFRRFTPILGVSWYF